MSQVVNIIINHNWWSKNRRPDQPGHAVLVVSRPTVRSFDVSCVVVAHHTCSHHVNSVAFLRFWKRIASGTYTIAKLGHRDDEWRCSYVTSHVDDRRDINLIDVGGEIRLVVRSVNFFDTPKSQWRFLGFNFGKGALGWRHFNVGGGEHTANTFVLNYRVCNRLYQIINT